MKRFMLSAVGLVMAGNLFAASVAVSPEVSRAGATVATANSAATTAGRGSAGAAAAYRLNAMNSYYMVTQPDVDTACRERIFKCLADYCGDVTVVPGQHGGRCTSAGEGELYNWTLICLQKDNSVLLPQYGVSSGANSKGMNTAARLCPSYVQQELMTYLSMANMAEKLTLQRSDLCLSRRRELEAAMSCHEVALAYGRETANFLRTQLTETCGAGMPGGSAEMVMKYANAGNVGGNIIGWAEKIVTLDLSNKDSGWQAAVDSVLAGYVNRMNLACGENMSLTLASHPADESSILEAVATVAVASAFPDVVMAGNTSAQPIAGTGAQQLWMDVKSMSDATDYATAKQIVMAGLSNSPLTQNAFLSSAQMDSMQRAYKLGTKVFVLRDTARCWTVPVATLTSTEESLIAQQFASCVGK